MLEVTVHSGFDWVGAVTAAANIGLLVVAAWAGWQAREAVIAARAQIRLAETQHEAALEELQSEHRRSENRHAQQLSAAVRPLLQILEVIVPSDGGGLPTALVSNVGVGPARAVEIEVRLKVIRLPIDRAGIQGLFDVAAPARHGLAGGLRANGGERRVDLLGDAQPPDVPPGYQLIAFWTGRCEDIDKVAQTPIEGFLFVRDQYGNVL